MERPQAGMRYSREKLVINVGKIEVIRYTTTEGHYLLKEKLNGSVGKK